MPRELPALRLEELDSETASLLPARQTLCQFACTNVVNLVGVDVALAINAATISSSADALAQQYITSVYR